MTIEEKRKYIDKHCDKVYCHECVLNKYHNASVDVCYELDDNTIERMFIDLINSKLGNVRLVNEEAKKPTIMQDRVAVPVDKGTMTIKGTCYEDVLNILCRNGYATNMHTQPCKKNLGEIEHIIIFWKEPFETDQMKGE